MKKRLFFGIEVSGEARSNAANYIDDLAARFPNSSAKWERPEKLHITLKFLGSVDELKRKGLLAALEEIRPLLDPFTFEVVGTGSFPSGRKPRVLWFGVKETTGVLINLARRVDDICFELGFEFEAREFRPHLTIARIHESNRATDLASAHTSNNFGPIQCLCSELVLFESRLDRVGSVYTKFAAVKFSDA